MRPIVKNLVFGAVGLAVGATVVSGALNFTVLAQVAAPSTSTPLPQATVKALQEALNKQGIAVKADGVWGDETRAAIRKYQSQHHLPVTGEPDKATLDKLGVAGQRSEASGGPAMAGVSAPGMMGMMGGMAGQGASQGGMGPGMMGQGQMPMMGGMALMGPGQGGMPCATGASSMGAGSMMGVGPAALYGMPRGPQAEIDPAKAKTMVEGMLAWHGNPRLKLGEVRETDLGEIVVDIMTQEGSLVHRLAIDRRTGAVRQVD